MDAGNMIVKNKEKMPSVMWFLFYRKPPMAWGWSPLPAHLASVVMRLKHLRKSPTCPNMSHIINRPELIICLVSLWVSTVLSAQSSWSFAENVWKIALEINSYFEKKNNQHTPKNQFCGQRHLGGSGLKGIRHVPLLQELSKDLLF